MCGICGIVDVHSGVPIDPDEVRGMMRTIVHRGPDADGLFQSPQAVLGHRRLSIIDLDSGRQPIANEDETMWIVFNGEIYNYRELREDLCRKGHVFRTNSDTEVIVHLYEEYGVDCVSLLSGMFAFAIWNSRSRSFFLARDRVGIKPVYYAHHAGRLYFASELKAILACPGIERTVEPQAIDDFLTYMYGPGSSTMLRGIYKLLPGHWMRVEAGRTTVRQYWDLEFSQARANRTEASLSEELVALLDDVVRGHMISDVPVGVLLSGGVDSTAMLSYAVDHTDQQINTFTVGFSGERFADERPFAKMAAERYGSRHHEITLTAEDFWNFLPSYVWHMEEPVCEPPAIALYYVTKLAREHVKVLLSGEGGDEAFAGYQNYRNLMWLERLKSLGPVVRGAAALGLSLAARADASGRMQKYQSLIARPLPNYYFSRTAGPYSPLIQAKRGLYSDALNAQLGGTSRSRYLEDLFAHCADSTPLQQMQYVDTKTWLPDDLLLKADKITMASSVELRVPLLDHRVLEFAGTLPDAMKVRGAETKYLLKKALADRIPAAIRRRPKVGFPVPYATWLQSELNARAREVLLDDRTLSRPYFDPTRLSKFVIATASDRNRSGELFSLLTLELWHRAFIDRA
jgi:asparagine synthase (glutamine-hydrolysing)